MASTATTIIYALCDPRDEVRHYVGKTSQLPGQRLRQHVQHPQTEALANWFAELEAEDYQPKMIVLEELTPDEDWRIAEIYWIKEGLRQGWPLKNTNAGGDDLSLIRLLRAEPEAILKRTLYGSEATFRLMVQLNAYFYRRRAPHDWIFADLLHEALLVLQAEVSDSAKKNLHEKLFFSGVVQMGYGWRVPVQKKHNLEGGVFLRVGRPFHLEAMTFPGNWNGEEYQTTLEIRKKTSDLLDDLAAVRCGGKRRGYDATLFAALNSLADIFDEITQGAF
ncbi:MAG: GIY-YIG nuclease family protein [Anaerolineae bacterium]|nr:GIY-YIG nuclease family protein [Anaerolineae bacterium]